MKTFKLHLIRHGLTSGNLQGLYIGSGTDIPLCDEGRAQLAELKERFEYPQVDTVFSSPLMRAVETANILFPNATHQFSVHDLREAGFGVFENHPVKELVKNEDFKKWITPGSGFVPEGAEPTEQFHARCSETLLKLFEFMLEFLLVLQHEIQFFVQIVNDQFTLEIDAVIILGAGAVFRLLTVLAHHDERRLHGGDAGKHEVEQDEGIRIKGALRHHDVENHPHHHHGDKAENERPAARKSCDRIRCALSERHLLVAIRIFGDRGHDQLMNQLLVGKFLIGHIQKLPDDLLSLFFGFHERLLFFLKKPPASGFLLGLFHSPSI